MAALSLMVSVWKSGTGSGDGVGSVSGCGAGIAGLPSQFGIRFAASHDLRDHPRDIHAGADLAAAGHAARRIPVVGIVEGGIDVVANGRIQRP